MSAPDPLRGGSDLDCSLEGVHAHSFRGPHYFREWEPGTKPAPDPAALLAGAMVCVLCRLSRPTGERNAAVTIVNGNASCDEHIDRLPYGDLSRAVSRERQDWQEAHRG